MLVFNIWVAVFKQAFCGVVLGLEKFFDELFNQKEFVKIQDVEAILLQHLVLIVAHGCQA